MPQNPSQDLIQNEWLQRLKQESWEAELLVAAVSIFGTFQLFAFVSSSTNTFINILPPSLYLVAYFVVFSAQLAVSILASMFVIHFMLRAYWVGLVGLNSVFSDYTIEKEDISTLHLQKLIQSLPRLNDSVTRADRLCSVIFAAAFGLLMAYGWMFLSGSAYLLFFNYASRTVPQSILIIPPVLLTSIMAFQLLVNLLIKLPALSKSEIVQIFYFRLNVLASVVAFGPLYKAILQISTVFGSNFKKDKALVYLVILFICCGFVFAAYKVFSTNLTYLIKPEIFEDTSQAQPRFYRNLAQNDDFILSPQLSNNIIDRPVIEIFVPVFSHEDYLYKTRCATLADVQDEARGIRKAAELECLKNYHFVSIGDNEQVVNMIKTTHEFTGQDGVTIYVSLDQLQESGYQTIEVSKTIFDDAKTWRVPFYYIRHDSSK